MLAFDTLRRAGMPLGSGGGEGGGGGSGELRRFEVHGHPAPEEEESGRDCDRREEEEAESTQRGADSDDGEQRQRGEAEASDGGRVLFRIVSNATASRAGQVGGDAGVVHEGRDAGARRANQYEGHTAHQAYR